MILAASEDKQMDGQAGEELQKGINEKGVLPADCLREVMRYGPEDGRGEAAEQSEIGNRTARLPMCHLGERGKGRIIEDEAHRRSEHQPAGDIDPGRGCEREDQAAKGSEA